MGTIVKQLKSMYEQELYSSIIQISDMTLTLSEQKSDFLTLPAKFQVTFYYAHALYHTRQYLQAENLYRQSLQFRKTIITKSRNSNQKITENKRDMASDVDVKYHIYKCCVALRQRKAAMDILQTIAAKQRTAKINMALGGIYKENKMERSAIMCYKEVLRECPLAIDAMEHLFKLGVNGIEVNALVAGMTTDVPWLITWIRAQSHLHARDYSKAIKSYKCMDTHGLLKDNTYLLVNMGYCYHYMCQYNKALSMLQTAVRLDPNLIFGRDLLSTLLTFSANKDRQVALENLTSNLDSSLWAPQHWVCLGNLMFSLKKFDKAVYFGHQACLSDTEKNVEGLFLKANALFQLKKYQEASVHCTEAIQICPYRYDLHKCLVDCYLHSNRLREAESMAINACKELNNSPLAYCLHASCLLKDPVASVKNVNRILEKAYEQDKHGQTSAVYKLAELLIKEQQYDQAIQILQKAVEEHIPTSQMHQLLGECYVNLQKDDEAFNHFTVALRLNPENQRATEGLNNIGRSLSVSTRDQYYSCADESCNSRRTDSDHEVDGESDTELWPGSVDMANFDG